jgi:putative SOS response-associated peptidase YedK
MCGRYRLSRRKQIIEERFDAIPEPADDEADAWTPRYNIAPSQLVPVVRQRPNQSPPNQPRRELSVMRWGLIPSWATDPAIGSKTINARAETVTTTASFRDAFRSQRCLIPADGFYEWPRKEWQRKEWPRKEWQKNTKQPYCFEVADGELFAFAGLWDQWTDPQGKAVETCTILTTTPNALLADFHDRMPAILRPDDYDRWLNPQPGDTATALRLLVPYAGTMRRYPVSTRVNFVQNDDPDCAKPVELEPPAQGQLFG